MFQTLLGEPRFAAVLQFYAGFTELANHGVRKVIMCNLAHAMMQFPKFQG